MTFAKVKIMAMAAVAVCVIPVVRVTLADVNSAAPSHVSLLQPNPPAPIPLQTGEVPNVASLPPVVVATEPQAGRIDVDAVTFEIKITFSKPMKDGQWSWIMISTDTFPKVINRPHFLDDHKTCILPVQLLPGHSYALWINSSKLGNFQDEDGHPAVPYLLAFQTKR